LAGNAPFLSRKNLDLSDVWFCGFTTACGAGTSESVNLKGVQMAGTTYCSNTTTGAKLRIRLSPKASHDRIGTEHNGRLKVSVTSPPIDGKANLHLIRLLSKKLHVPKSSIEIVAGDSSREKTLLIENQKAEDILQQLEGR
jgi:hypothetical protein